MIYKINSALISGYLALGLGLPTAYENRDFTQPSNGQWAAVFNLPADKVPVSLGDGGFDEYVGVFQIDFHMPENSGTKSLHQWADATTAYFKPGSRITYSGVQVLVRKASASAIRRDADDGSFVISVSVTWTSQVQRDATIIDLII